MKTITKLFSIFTVVLMLALTMGLTVGCGDENSDDSQWDGRTYVITVYQPDGTTPMQNVRLALCGNTSESTSQCLTPVKTDANGTVTIVVPENVSFIGNPVIHFTHEADLQTFGFPTNMSSVTMNDSSVYPHALELTEKTTKIVLSTAN